MESEDLELLRSIMSDRREVLEAQASDWTNETSSDLFGASPTVQTRALIHGVFDSYLAVLFDDDYTTLSALMERVIELRAGMLFHVSTPQRGFYSFRKAVESELVRRGLPQEQHLRILIGIDEVYIESMYRFSDGFSAKLNATFEQLYEEARIANIAKQNFLASMSHELRTPLNAILGTCEALQEEVYGTLSEPQSDALSMAHASGCHLLSLVNDLLDLSKIEAEAFEPHFESMSLVETCTETTKLMRTAARQAGLKLGLMLDGEVDTIVSDVRRVRQMVLNLVGNAVKFTPSGGRVTVSLERRGDDAVISVSDTGHGISAAELPKLFRAFSQTDSSLTSPAKGTGMGLHLTRRLATALGGGVTVESEVGVGSCFEITLPIRGAVADVGLDEGAASRPKGTGTSGANNVSNMDSAPVSEPKGAPSGRDVLLVDDTPGNISHVRDFLRSKGHRVSVATNGVEAIEQAQTLPDVVLMDVQMPVMDGLEATRRLRADEHTRGLFIVALTSYAMGEDRARCFEAGADMHESKPVGLKRLLEIVEKEMG